MFDIIVRLQWVGTNILDVMFQSKPCRENGTTALTCGNSIFDINGAQASEQPSSVLMF